MPQPPSPWEPTYLAQKKNPIKIFLMLPQMKCEKPAVGSALPIFQKPSSAASQYHVHLHVMAI